MAPSRRSRRENRPGSRFISRIYLKNSMIDFSYQVTVLVTSGSSASDRFNLCRTYAKHRRPRGKIGASRQRLQVTRGAEILARRAFSLAGCALSGAACAQLCVPSLVCLEAQRSAWPRVRQQRGSDLSHARRQSGSLRTHAYECRTGARADPMSGPLEPRSRTRTPIAAQLIRQARPRSPTRT
jgi:hypothetical protein